MVRDEVVCRDDSNGIGKRLVRHKRSLFRPRSLPGNLGIESGEGGQFVVTIRMTLVICRYDVIEAYFGPEPSQENSGQKMVKDIVACRDDPSGIGTNLYATVEAYFGSGSRPCQSRSRKWSGKMPIIVRLD